jgi:hypothetical protein
MSYIPYVYNQHVVYEKKETCGIDILPILTYLLIPSVEKRIDNRGDMLFLLLIVNNI